MKAAECRIYFVRLREIDVVMAGVPLEQLEMHNKGLHLPKSQVNPKAVMRKEKESNRGVSPESNRGVSP